MTVVAVVEADEAITVEDFTIFVLKIISTVTLGCYTC